MTAETKPVKARIRKLVRALRTGKVGLMNVRQTRHTLRKGRAHAFCCLGVACEVYRRETGRGRWSQFGVFHATPEDAGSASLLPDEVRQWYGFTDCNPWFGPHPVRWMWDAIGMNDEGCTFEEIADAFSEEYLT